MAEWRLKLKYRNPANLTKIKKGNYRTRTGPNCCNANCGSTRKKAKKNVRRTVQQALGAFKETLGI